MPVQAAIITAAMTIEKLTIMMFLPFPSCDRDLDGN
jgi:hypothetical protein